MQTAIKHSEAYQLIIEHISQIFREVVATELQKANNVILLNPEPEKDKLMSRAETAALLGVSLTTLFRWNNNKTLPNQKLGGRVYYQKSDIMNKLNNVV
jgi:predicted DNA-binding transcriptional regulator AlpA